jgi:hypothetical protein
VRLIAAVVAVAPALLVTGLSACGLIEGVGDFRVSAGVPDAKAAEASGTVDTPDGSMAIPDAADVTVVADTSPPQEGGNDGPAPDEGADAIAVADSAIHADTNRSDAADGADSVAPPQDSIAPPQDSIAPPQDTSVRDTAVAADTAPDQASSGCTATGIAWKQTTTFVSGTPITTLTLPTPSLAAKGDVMLAFLTGGIDPGASPTLTAPPGWTLVGGATNGPGSMFSAFIQVYFKVVVAHEPASYAWTSSVAVDCASWMLDYAGVDPSAPIDVQTGQDDGADAGASGYATPSFMTSVPDEVVIAAFANHDNGAPKDSAASWSVPSGMVERAFATDGTARQAAADDILEHVAGVVGPFEADTSGIQKDVLTYILALRPCP